LASPYLPNTISSEPKEEDRIVSTKTLSDGHTNYFNQKAQNLVPIEPYQKETSYSSLNQAMHGVGAELSNPEVKKDRAWWKKALGVLEPLKYMDIPIELIAEAVVDPISMATGKQLSPLRGSADRKQFEAWRSLFGGDTSEKTGWGEFKSRIDIASEAFEKRPLKMQLALGVAQIAATGGGYGLAKGAATAGSLGGKAAARAGSIGLRAIDPLDVAMSGAGKGLKKGFHHSPFKIVRKAKLGESDIDPQKFQFGGQQPANPIPLEGPQFDKFFLGDLLNTPVEERLLGSGWKIGDSDSGIGSLFPFNPRYGPSNAIYPVPLEDISPLYNPDSILEGFEDGLSPVMHRGNNLRKLFHDLWKPNEALTGTPMANENVITRSRDLALVHLQLSTGSRPGSIQNLKMSELTKWLKDFKDTKILKPLPISGMEAGDLADFRTGNVHVGDYEAIFALDNYVAQLENMKMLPKANQKIFSAPEIYAGGKATVTVDSVVKKYNKMGYNLGPDGKYLRNQKASEMYLEGWSLQDIATKLNHKGVKTTQGYIRDWSISHDQVAKEYRAGFELASSIDKDALDVIQKDAGAAAQKLKKLEKDWQEAIEARKQSPLLKARAKGLVFGFQQINEVADVIGGAFKNALWDGDELSPLAKMQGLVSNADYAAYKNFIDYRDHISYNVVKENLKDVLSLIALRRMSQRMRASKNILETKKAGIYQPYGKNFQRHATGGGGEGILNRAGFIEINGEIRDRFDIDDLKNINTKKWRNRRARLAAELGFENWTDADWKQWANGLWDERRKVDDSLLEPDRWEEIRKGIVDVKGQRRGGLAQHWVKSGKAEGGKIYEILEHYIDDKVFDVRDSYATHSKAMESQLNIGHLPFDDLINDLEIVGSGVPIGYGQAVSRFGVDYIKVRNAFEKEVEFSSALDPIVRPGAAEVNAAAEEGMARVPEVRFMDKTTAEQKLAVQQWLGEDRIRQVLRGRNFYKHMDVDRANNKLFQLAKDRPKLFGNGFEDMASGEQQEFLDNIFAHIFSKGENGRSLSDDFAERARLTIDPEHKRFPRRRERALRQRFPEVETHLNGVDTNKGTGVALSIDQLVPFINKGRATQAINEYWNKDHWWKPVKPFIEIIGTAILGGKAMFTRHVTKGISARGHAYSKAEDLGVRATAVANGVMREADLGLFIDDATANQLANGLDRGNQFFGNLKVKNIEEIMEWELSHKGELQPNTLRQLNGMLQADPDDAKKWLTQVDVVLERIEPEHWDRYFDFGGPEGSRHKAGLVFLKDMIDEMDAKALNRGVNIVERVKNNGGKYLKNYFPRIYRHGRDTRLAQKHDPNAALNSFASQFQARSQEDVLHQLLDPARHEMGKAVDHTVMEDVAERIGQYVETMWKEVADEETIKWLRGTEAFKIAKGTAKAYREAGPKTTAEISAAGSRQAVRIRRLELESLKRIVNDKVSGIGKVDPKRQGYVDASTNPAMAQFQWAIESGDHNIERVREVSDRILKFIKEEEMALTDQSHLRFVSEVKGAEWIDSTLRHFEAKDQKAIREFLAVADDMSAKPLTILANLVRKPTNIIRTFKAGFDIGAPMIHGFNSAVRIPLPGKGQTQAGWLKSNKKMFELLAHPEYYDTWLVDNLDNVSDIGQFVRLGHAEPVRQMQADEWYQNFKRWLTSEQDRGLFMGKKMGKTMQKAMVANRFETGFSGYLDMLRVENWKALSPSLERSLAKRNKQMYITNEAGQRVLNTADTDVAGKLHELGAVINKMTGAYDTHLAQVTPYQSLIESSLFFFAPLYRRATYGIIFDVFRGGMRGREAVQQLTGVMLAGGMLGAMASKAQGNEEFFNLDDPYKFGKFEVNGVRMGVGTAWWTAFRVLADVRLQFENDPEREVTEDTFKDHWVWEILKRRGRSQLAPGSSIAVDIASGKTFAGDPLRDEHGDPDFISIGQHIGRSAVPFWLDGAFAGGFGGALVAMPSEALGLQAYAIQDYDQLSYAQQNALESWEDEKVRTWRMEEDRLGHKIDWTTAPQTIKDRIYDHHPEVAMMYDTYKQSHGELQRGTAKDMADWTKDNAQHELVATQELTRATRQYMRGEITAENFRDAFKEIRTSKRLASTAMMDNGGRYEPLAMFFGELRRARSEKGLVFQGDLLYDKWITEVVASDAFDDAEGNRIMGAYDKAELQWRMDNDITPALWDYMQERKNMWLNEMSAAGLQPIADLMYAKEALKPYWDIHDTIWEPGSEMNAEAEYYYSFNEDRREDLKASNKRYRYIEKKVARARKRMRLNNINMDRLLTQWYGHTPLHKINQEFERSFRLTQDSNSINGIPGGVPRAEDWVVRPSGRVGLSS